MKQKKITPEGLMDKIMGYETVIDINVKTTKVYVNGQEADIVRVETNDFMPYGLDGKRAWQRMTVEVVFNKPIIRSIV